MAELHSLRPGERIVGNTVMYSSLWLNNGSEFLHADRNELLNALPADREAAVWLTGRELVWLHHHLGELPFQRGASEDDRIYEKTRDAIQGLLALKEDR